MASGAQQCRISGVPEMKLHAVQPTASNASSSEHRSLPLTLPLDFVRWDA
jgi:hypothetical protein